jgi:hypothetical protein
MAAAGNGQEDSHLNPRLRMAKSGMSDLKSKTPGVDRAFI